MDTEASFLAAAREPNTAYMASELFLKLMLVQHGLSEMATLSKEGAFSHFIGGAVRKGSPWKPVIDDFLSRVSAAGLADKWMNMTMEISRQEYYKKLRSTESSAVDGNNLDTSLTRGYGFSETDSELTIAIKLDHLQGIFDDQVSVSGKPCCGFQVPTLLGIRVSRISSFISLELYLVPNQEWGIQMKNGSFDGLIGELSENRADIVANILAISRARMKFVDFTKPYIFEYTTFVTRKPDEISKAYAIAKPFSDQTLKRKEYSLLWDRLQSSDHRGPGILTNAPSRAGVISAVQEKKRAHIVGKICTGILLQMGLEEMAVMSPGMNMLSQMMGVAVRKGSPLLPVVDQMISRMLAAGLIDFWTRRSLAKSRQEYGVNNFSGPSSKEEKIMALKLEHNYAAFFVLGIGTALSCFVFLSERLFFKLTAHKCWET
ncbi:unnamed protein product [Notodromas monacha]|uniref:Ionotropic glutamate receptor L-glutamate and glycine-binding domain-containing protein n=1 Tax=Notodromas monacha TaxID=399045 RepID=A0A7R9GGK9_9CRUS|nr:unnamed protein product [Notodromas monacha]CAG0920516.1 unnamed protein product [Notodromas monacha]